VSAGLALGEVPNNPTLVGIALAIPSAIIVSVGGLEAHALARTLSPRARAVARARIAATRRLSLIAGLGFGLFFIALAQASSDSGLYPLVGARGASIAVLAIFLTSRRSWNTIPRSDFGSIGIAGLLDFAANSFYLLALADGSVTWVAAVVSLYPVCTVLLARVLLKEELSRVQIAGLVMASSALVFVGFGAA
jgi:drug/metabolite transporter (DMT)-like permease